MKMSARSRIFLNGALLVSAATMLSGCGFIEWLKQKTCQGCATHGADEAVEPQRYETADANKTLISMKGKSVMTVAEFEKTVDLYMADPSISGFLKSMPAEQKCAFMTEIARGIALEAAVLDYVDGKAIDKKLSPEDKSQVDMLEKRHKSERAIFLIDMELKADNKTSDSDLKAFFEKYKAQLGTDPRFVMSMGGVRTMGLKAKNKDEADRLKKRLDEKVDINKIAQDNKRGVEDFGVVNAQSVTADRKVIEAVMGMKTFPSSEVVKVGEEFMVVHGSKKIDPEFKSFDAMKDDLKTLYEREVLPNKLRPAKIEEIRAKADVKIDDALLKKMCSVSTAAPASEEATTPEETQETPEAKDVA